MFSTIKSKIIAALSILVAVMFAALKFMSNKNKELKREVKIKDKQTEIRREQDKIKKEVIENEDNKIEEVKSNLKGNRSSKLNSVLNNRNNSWTCRMLRSA